MSQPSPTPTREWPILIWALALGLALAAVVPEWGWAVLTYLLHQAGSWPLLVAWVCLLAVVTGAGLTLLARAFAGRPALGPVALSSGWAAGQVALRMRLRPEMINLVLLPLGLLLARLCAELGDARCVRTQGLRAAVGGSTKVAPALAWLREHPASEQDRVDAEVWLKLLAAEPAPVANGGR